MIAERLQARQHAYMPASLLGSQLAALEPPMPDEGAITLNSDQTLAEQLDTVVSQLG